MGERGGLQPQQHASLSLSLPSSSTAASSSSSSSLSTHRIERNRVTGSTPVVAAQVTSINHSHNSNPHMSSQMIHPRPNQHQHHPHATHARQVLQPSMFLSNAAVYQSMMPVGPTPTGIAQALSLSTNIGKGRAAVVRGSSSGMVEEEEMEKPECVPERMIEFKFIKEETLLEHLGKRPRKQLYLKFEVLLQLSNGRHSKERFAIPALPRKSNYSAWEYEKAKCVYANNDGRLFWKSVSGYRPFSTGDLSDMSGSGSPSLSFSPSQLIHLTSVHRSELHIFKKSQPYLQIDCDGVYRVQFHSKVLKCKITLAHDLLRARKVTSIPIAEIDVEKVTKREREIEKERESESANPSVSSSPSPSPSPSPSSSSPSPSPSASPSPSPSLSAPSNNNNMTVQDISIDDSSAPTSAPTSATATPSPT